jgi:lipid-A-disaccharide synthase-like uncharacterized protein
MILIEYSPEEHLFSFRYVLQFILSLKDVCPEVFYQAIMMGSTTISIIN